MSTKFGDWCMTLYIGFVSWADKHFGVYGGMTAMISPFVVAVVAAIYLIDHFGGK